MNTTYQEITLKKVPRTLRCQDFAVFFSRLQISRHLFQHAVMAVEGFLSMELLQDLQPLRLRLKRAVQPTRDLPIRAWLAE